MADWKTDERRERQVWPAIVVILYAGAVAMVLLVLKMLGVIG